MPTQADVARYQAALNDAHDYADWAETGDAGRARKFITAVDRLILLVPAQSERTGQSVRFDQRLWAEQRRQAAQFVQSSKQSASGGIAYYETHGGRYQ